MKKLLNKSLFAFITLPLLALVISTGCNRLDNVPTHNYAQTNLVSDEDNEEYEASRIDETLVNPWGIAVNPNGPIWIASEGSGMSQVYDNMGGQIIPAVMIPGPDPHTPGHPTGIVFNGTTDFVIPGTGLPAKFIYVGVDGIVSAWNGGSAAIIIANNAGTAVYTGITLGNVGSNNYIYAANFAAGKIDVWDKDFHWVNMSFTDPNLPAGYAPYNIRLINRLLYVTYAMVDPVTHHEQKGVGLGIVNVFTPNGTFVRRFATGGTLNAPWGLAASTPGFDGRGDAILIGNFGDGKINVFDALGRYKGQIMSKGMPLEIEGLWALETNVPGTDPGLLYFTAGIDDEAHGLFGYIMHK
ncbi:TIGR03118 family protein [Ilyomonas limi]|uniref:TIGR03118 family protein n=1 Tax=Ilyomonas limi TaxID=2575867 RepID=A0A4U3L2G7_9BACT|nr:TIGR03118 family protein [Ilyomonas limi]TKK69351.1 TIGR03118 family protein [Ilyomonas limi]